MIRGGLSGLTIKASLHNKGETKTCVNYHGITTGLMFRFPSTTYRGADNYRKYWFHFPFG